MKKNGGNKISIISKLKDLIMTDNLKEFHFVHGTGIVSITVEAENEAEAREIVRKTVKEPGTFMIVEEANER
jgi:hypothetical protein